MAAAEEVITLVCPRGARVGQPLYFQEPGSKEPRRTTVPPGVRPGQKFDVSRSSLALSGAEVSRKMATGRLRASQSEAALGSRSAAGSLAAAAAAADNANTFSGGGVARFTTRAKRIEAPLTEEDRSLVAKYRERIRSGRANDERWWTDQGFKVTGGKMSKQKMKDYGHGVPKWSPYYQGDPSMKIPEEFLNRSSALGDQPWWEQWGFKGAMTEEKKRDYGNGVPKWSPYHHMGAAAAATEDLPPLNMPADAFWFSQFGFKTGTMTEETKRDYGDGIPKWSPYSR